MFRTVLRQGMIDVPITYEIRDENNNLATLSGYDSVRLYIEGYSSSYLTATVNSAGNVTVTFPTEIMADKSVKKAYFVATDNTNTDFIPIGEVGEIVVKGTWE